MGSFKRAVYKVGLIEDTESVSCNDTLIVDGQSGIYDVNIIIGTGTGITGLRYEAFNVPDRFQLIFDGNIVADTKFVGEGLNTYRNALLNIQSLLLPVFEYNGSEFVDSGRMESTTIDSGDIADGTVTKPTAGKGTLRFTKEKAEVTTMKLRVIAPLGGTAWNASPICPYLEIPNKPERELIDTSIKIYTMNSFNFVRPVTCEEFNEGTIRPYYSIDILDRGTKLYMDRQLLRPIPTGVYYLGGIVYEVKDGVVIDTYPCHQGVIL